MKTIAPALLGCAIAALPLSAPPAAAQAVTQDLDSIDQAVAQFTGRPAGEAGGAVQGVDRRLRLARCAGPLQLGWFGLRRSAVEVRCTQGTGWRVYVGIRAADTVVAAPAAMVVTRGQMVSVIVRAEGFQLSRPGEALDSGAVGDWVRIRTDAKGEILRARVISGGEVGMDLP